MTDTQLDFDHYRASDPSTSQAAAQAVDINRKCREVLAVIWRHRHSSPWFTDGDLAAWCEEDRNIVARRRGDLVTRGIVEPVYHEGFHSERLDQRGRMAKLWTLTEFGYVRGAEVAS